MAAFEHLLLQLLVFCDEHANAGAAGAEPFGHGVYYYGVVCDVFKLGDGIKAYIPIVNKLPIYLISDDKQVVGLGYICKYPHLFFS